MPTFALLLLGSLFMLGCGRASAKPASRAEALGACERGCFKSALKELGEEATAKLFCGEMCTCLIGHRFDAAGKQTKSTPQEFARQQSECADRAHRKLEQQQQQP